MLQNISTLINKALFIGEHIFLADAAVNQSSGGQSVINFSWVHKQPASIYDRPNACWPEAVVTIVSP